MEMKFYPCKKPDGKIVAFADVEVNEGITVRGFRIVEGDKGLFAAVPSRGFTVDGKPRFYNQVAFATSELKECFLSELLEGYHQWRKTQDQVREASSEANVLAMSGRDETPPF